MQTITTKEGVEWTVTEWLETTVLTQDEGTIVPALEIDPVLKNVRLYVNQRGAIDQHAAELNMLHYDLPWRFTTESLRKALEERWLDEVLDLVEGTEPQRQGRDKILWRDQPTLQGIEEELEYRYSAEDYDTHILAGAYSPLEAWAALERGEDLHVTDNHSTDRSDLLDYYLVQLEGEDAEDWIDTEDEGEAEAWKRLQSAIRQRGAM